MSEKLIFEPILNHPELVSDSVYQAVRHWSGSVPVEELRVAEIDPQFAGGEDLCAHYGVDPAEGANCIVVEGIRGEERTITACLIPVGLRADLNGTVRKHLNARRVSFAPLDQVLAATGMEYGSITPLGLPPTWRILIASSLSTKDRIIVGGGLKRSKLSLPIKALQEIPNAEIVEGMV